MAHAQARTHTRTRTPSADVTRSLLGAAGELLERDGQDAITVRAVAAKAGVAPNGVYSRFGGKDGLLEALFVQGFQDLHAVINQARGSDARSRLFLGCMAYRAFAVAHPNRYELMFRQMKELELGPDALEQAERAFAQLVGRVEDAQAAGAVRAGNPVEIAQLIWNALHGGVSLESIGVSFSADPEANFAAMIEALLVGLARA